MNNLETTIRRYNDADYIVTTISKEFSDAASTDKELKALKEKAEADRDAAAACVVLAFIGHLNGKTIEDEQLREEARRITHRELEMDRINREAYYHVESVVSDVETKIAQYRAADEEETKMIFGFSNIANEAVQKKIREASEKASATFMYALQMYVYAKERNVAFAGADYFIGHITAKLGASANKKND